MAKAKRIVSIEMDKERHLKFGINALIELEELLDRPLTELGEGGFKFADLRAMLYVGLKWEDKKLTVSKIGDLMDDCIAENGMEYLSGKLGEALSGNIGATAMPSDK